MIATLIIIFLILNYVFDMEQEIFYKIMLVICFINLIPILLYAVYALSVGNVSFSILFLMTLL
jgi:hypothetical protein